MEFKDYYATLGVAKTATEKEIKQAYRKLARKTHPDVNPGDKNAEARFKSINEAYEVLGDPEKRRKYDELGANWRQYEQAQQQGRPGPFGDGAWTVNVGGGEGGSRTMTEDEMRRIFGDQDPFSDFFHAFFGGGTPESQGRAPRQGRGARAKRGRDVEQDLELTLEDAFHGATRRFAIKHEGHTRSVDVRIPAGVNDGSRVRVTGEGEHGAGGASAGDLYLRVHLAAPPALRAPGPRPPPPRPRAGHHGRARRRSRGPEHRRQAPSAEGPVGHAERPGAAAQGTRDAGRRTPGGSRRSVRHRGCPAPPLPDA